MSAAYPALDIDTGRIFAAAGEIRRLGGEVHELAVEADRRWQQLATGYAAPETPVLLRFPSVRIVPRTEDTRDGTDGVAQALTDFADDVGPWLIALRAALAVPLAGDDLAGPAVAAIHELEVTCARAIRAAIGLTPPPGTTSDGGFDFDQVCLPPDPGFDARRGVGPAGPIAALPDPEVVGHSGLTGAHVLDAVTGPTRQGELYDVDHVVYVQTGRDGASPYLRGGRLEYLPLYPAGTGLAQVLDLRFPPNTRFVVHQDGVPGAKAIYQTDAQGRVVRVELQVLPQSTRRDQVQGEHTRLISPTDDAGHLDAAGFGGSPEEINLVGQLPSSNRGGPWRGSEQEWLDLARSGVPVQGVIDVHYPPGSRRPDRLSRYESVGVGGVYTPVPGAVNLPN